MQILWSNFGEGCPTWWCLASASSQPGYQLVKNLAESGIPLEGNTVYPLLRRLEDQGLLRSDWDTSTDKPRKYYQITETGSQLLAQITSYWRDSVKNIESILEA